MIYPYNKSQQDALFTFNSFQLLTSTCFEQAYCSSSGATTLYIQHMSYVYVDWLLAGSIMPTASQQKRCDYNKEIQTSSECVSFSGISRGNNSNNSNSNNNNNNKINEHNNSIFPKSAIHSYIQTMQI